jgi:long-chain acyl-CoA synthetase
VLAESCERYNHRPAFENMGRVLSYGDVDRLSAAFASYLLHELKLKKGDRVAIMLPNLLQYPIAIFGALRAGLVVVNTNPMYTARELKHQLNDAGASAIVVLDAFASVLQEALPETRIKHVIVTSIGDMLAFPKSLVMNFAARHIKKLVPDYDIPGARRFNDALAAGGRHKLPPVDIGPEDIAVPAVHGRYHGRRQGRHAGASEPDREHAAGRRLVRDQREARRRDHDHGPAAVSHLRAHL